MEIAIIFLVVGFAFVAFYIYKKKNTKTDKQPDDKKTVTEQAEADIQKKLQDRRNIITIKPDGSVVVRFYEGGEKVYSPDEAKLLNIEPSNDMYADEDSDDNIDDNIDDDVVGVRTHIINSGCNLPIYTKAVGVTFDNHQENIAASKIGDALIIKHAPFGQYTESTDIINARTGGRIGRIKKELALSLLDEFDTGFVLDGEITDIIGGTDDAPHYGCNIKITAVAGG